MDISNANLPSLGVPNALPLVYTFDNEGRPIQSRDDQCYIKPITAHYLADECFVFNELDMDGSGALDEGELTEFVKLANDGGVWLRKTGAEILSEADGNNDGVV